MSADCRTFLREVLGGRAPLDATQKAHADACRFCSDRLAARDRLALALRQRPSLPIDPATLLAGVHARAVEQAEAAPLGRILDAAMLVPPMPTAGPAVDKSGVESSDYRPGWPVELLESRLQGLARQRPQRPSDITWSKVRGAILARVTPVAQPRLRRRWVLGFASAAALTCVFVFASRESHEIPTIVFRDLDSRQLASIPSVDFAVVRHGATR